ncbi:putative cytochrome P450 [Ixodes scapularis]
MEVPLVTAISVAFVVVVATAAWMWVLNRRRQHSLFARLGIPGPAPDLFSGNWVQLKKDPLEVMEHWIEKHGKMFGYYVGEIPYVAITDLEMIKQCFVKEDNVVCNRPSLIVSIEPFGSSLVGLSGDEWKRVRTVLNPIFTSVKLKAVTEIIRRCADEMLEILDDYAERGCIVDMTKVSKGLSLDVITKSAFAWQVDCQRNPSDPLLLAVQRIFNDSDNFLILSAVRFPALRKAMERIFLYSSYFKMITHISDKILKVLELRQSGQSPRANDMLQLMLDAQTGSEDANVDFKKRAKAIEDRHLLANCFIFLAAGFDTTASSLSFVMHLLAKYPEEQELVFDEIQKTFPGDAELTYDGLQQLKYLDMVICETLRMYPPVVMFTSRRCKEDTMVMGQLFPAGVNVIVPVWHIHHDPELWPDPQRFDPKRFDGEKSRNSAAYLPFGIGPRMCIGKRFALLELKLAICKIVRKYKVFPCEQTQDPLKFSVPTVVLHPKSPICVKLQQR